MIYSFGAKNYFSFREWMEVSFEFNSKVPKSISNGLKASTVLALKGANASGKTNILKALIFISKFISSSFDKDERDGLGFSSFFKSNEPSYFYIDFETKGVRYLYELQATPSLVIKESIFKKVQRKTLIIERKSNKITKRINELEQLDLIELKSSASVVCTAMKYKLKTQNEDLLNILEFFKGFRGNVSALIGPMHDDSFFTRQDASEVYYTTPPALEFAKKIIKNSDLGISDIEIHTTERSDGSKEYFPIFFHDIQNEDRHRRWLTSWDESSGTIALYKTLWIYWLTLALGDILVMDEFDINCHPMLLPQIIELFTNKEINKKNAQFIFTAHSSDIIDQLGKYRVILTNKEDGESYCYRLDEIPGDLIRNDRSIASLYREGKIGGIPKI